MGNYGDYLGQPIATDFVKLTAERKKQLRAISAARGGRDILVFAADLNKDTPLTAIGYVDILPITDQLSNLQGKALDLILETPGGSGEAAEDIVRLLRGKYEDIAVIIPGWAKSAGTIMAMAANEILMGPPSAVGPIDAQMFWQGKRFSADALLEGMEKIKQEVTDTGILNKAYIPILQGMSPGELQSAENALNFAKTLVTEWLAEYKFKNWATHSSTGTPVTDADKRTRAKEIADQLCDHRHWLTHGRSIKLDDLKKMRLAIVDYSQDAKLLDAISRYFALLQMTFATHIYKIYETPDSQILKFAAVAVPQQLGPQQMQGASVAVLDFVCSSCKTMSKIQANLGAPQPLQPGSLAFPGDNKFKCPKCGIEHDLTDTRRQIEAQARKPVV
jgi:ClpP class serine protease